MYKCIFCSIISRSIPADIIFENENILAFKDISPQAPQHVLIIPKKHIGGVMEFEDGDSNIIYVLIQAAQSIARQLGVDTSGFRLVVNSGKDAGQAVEHVHVHLLGGRKLQWPPG